jgi:hypothetical protein
MMVLAATGAMATLGTFVTFTSTTAVTQPMAAGALQVGVRVGAVLGRGLLSGDAAFRTVDLDNSSGVDLSSITLSTTANPSSALDRPGGLTMTVERCSVPWSPGSLGCVGGLISTVLAARPVLASSVDLPGLEALHGGGVDHLRVSLRLPGSAGAELEGLSSVITYSFVASQIG